MGPSTIADRSFGLCVLFLAAGAACANENIVIERGNCAAGVHLVARNAPLPDVLRRLADALGFQLELIAYSDSIIDVDVRKPAPELVANISTVDNLAVALASNAECPGEYGVVKVWVLPKGDRAPPRASSALSGATQPTEAQRKQMRQGENVYRRAHGMPLIDEDDPAQ